MYDLIIMLRGAPVALRTISEAPVPEYGGAPNLCEDLY